MGGIAVPLYIVVLLILIVKHGITMVSCVTSHAMHWYSFVNYVIDLKKN